MALENIFSRSFPGSNLFECSLVQDLDPELPFYKNKYFNFLSLTPGINNQQGGRTFDKEGRITVKTDCEELIALANSLRAWARGQGPQFGNYTKFVDSSKSAHGGGSIKMIFCSEFTPMNKQTNQADPKKRQISISFKQGQNQPIGVFFPPAMAMAIADILEFIAKKGLELEFQSRSVQVGQIKKPPQQNNYQQNSAMPGTMPPPNTPPPASSPNDIQGSFQGAMNNVSGGKPNNGMYIPPDEDDIPF